MERRPVKADASPNGGIHAKGRDRDEVRRGGQLLRLMTTNGGLHVRQE